MIISIKEAYITETSKMGPNHLLYSERLAKQIVSLISSACAMQFKQRKSTTVTTESFFTYLHIQ